MGAQVLLTPVTLDGAQAVLGEQGAESVGPQGETGVAVIVMVFALTMAGPRVHATARSEVGRTVAVVLEAIAFGGVLGAVIVLI